MDVDLSEFEGEGAEYRFLLQPVRDLASNWDIDISQHLEEYIRKLIGDSEAAELMDEHGRRKLFNFAEAAVLIHGSTNVYIKKVEYVYQIAVNFFDQLKEDKQKRRRKDDGTEDAEGGGDEDEDVENVYKNPFLQPEKRTARLEAMKNVMLKLSKKRPMLPIVPIAFTPLAEFEKTDVPLYNRTSKEIIGKKDDFKINMCYIHEAVALLDLKNADLIDRFTHFVDDNRPSVGDVRAFVAKEEHSVNEILRDASTQNDEFTHFTHDDDDYMAVDDVPLEDTASIVGGKGDGDHDSTMTMQQPNGEDRTLRSAAARELSMNAEEEVNDDALLDPYEEKCERSKPFKLNTRCCTVPAKQVKMRDYRIAKECQAKGVPNFPSVKTYIDSRMYRRKLKKRSYAFAQFNTFLIDQAILSLNSLFYEEEKRRGEIKKQRDIEAKNVLRAARRSRKRRTRNQAASVDFGQDDIDQPDDDAPMYEDVAEELGADEIINRNEPEEPEEFHQLGDYLQIDDLEDSLGVANLYADGLDNLGKNRNRAHFSSFGFEAQNMYDDTICPDVAYPDELPPRPISQMEYDELVAYHLRKYWSTAEEATSKFCERVQKWEEKMAPLLEKEQTYREFDTRQYGDELLEMFGNKVGTTIDFASAIKNCVNYDKSRYLLVSLILANTQNVQVINSSSSDEATGENAPEQGAVNQIKLKLLKLERHHEVFEDEQRLITGQPNHSEV